MSVILGNSVGEGWVVVWRQEKRWWCWWLVSVDYLIVLKEQRYGYSIVQRQGDDAIDRTSWQLSGRLKVGQRVTMVCAWALSIRTSDVTPEWSVVSH